uniref:Uncharacterized protein n=1 Tax=Oryza sativa subsp. japonica TaxID=39947 RepID=Q84SW5_ORYSJ|nr:hypothetical protein [Oryza sativa Japonica Group]
MPGRPNVPVEGPRHGPVNAGQSSSADHDARVGRSLPAVSCAGRGGGRCFRPGGARQKRRTRVEGSPARCARRKELAISGARVGSGRGPVARSLGARRPRRARGEELAGLDASRSRAREGSPAGRTREEG